MKVDAGSNVSAVGRARRDARTGGAAFSLDGAGGAGRASASAGLSQAQALGAALALQMEAIDPEQRRRQLRRGEKALDALDGVTLALLKDGRMDVAERALQTAIEEAGEQTGDPGLDEILALIEQRAAVELAKLEMRRKR